tara:strand:+ start:690 stop:1493 length:804 start_codon:yes stop_codon:yes gene_type:complete
MNLKNFLIKLNHSIIHFLRYLYLIKFNKFEIEILVLKSLIKKNFICFDIGCCHGSYARLLTKLSKQVYAFEPEKENFNYLKDVMNQKNLKIYNLAISDKEKISKLYIPKINHKKNTGMSSLLQNTNNENFKLNKYNGLVSQKVKTITLDSFVKKNRIKKIDFIKIDVEGHELQVLKKATNVLKKNRPILMIEILNDKKKDYKKVFKLMRKLNYLSYYLNRKNLKLNKCTYNDMNKFQSKQKLLLKNKNFFDQNYIQNFFFLPKKIIN